MRGSTKVATRNAGGRRGPFDGHARRLSILLVTATADGASTARADLEAAGCDVQVAELTGDLESGARRIAAEAEAGRLIVCDCGGDQACERAFFLCRASGDRTVVLLAVGDDVEDEPIELLVAAMRKALPTCRIALVSDRVPESERPSGGARRTPLTKRRTAKLAELLRAIADRSTVCTENGTFRL